MATNSFLKSVTIRGSKHCNEFIRAIEKSANSTKEKDSCAYQSRDFTQEKIRKVFGDK